MVFGCREWLEVVAGCTASCRVFAFPLVVSEVDSVYTGRDKGDGLMHLC